MAAPSPPISTTTSRYREFQRRRQFANDADDTIALVDEDGANIYETEYRGLLFTIIELNDVATLNQYLAKYPWALWPGETYYDDPFWAAAHHGSNDALRVLLEHYVADPTRTVAPDARGYLLLNVACRSAHVDTVRFLLDSQPAFGDTYARDDGGGTALLSAAASLAYVKDDRHGSIRDYVARGEELMQLLLDRGACARDVLHRGAFIPPGDEQPRNTVLGLAISRASPELVKHLIDEGANVHTKEMLFIQHGRLALPDPVWDVTPLHVSSFYLNTEGIQVLFTHRGSGIDIADMVLCRDTNGRLPLHFATGGPPLLPKEDYMLLKDDIILHAISTIKLLVTCNPSTINAQDNQGQTALHYAISSYAGFGGKYSDVIKVLCENGADSSLRGTNGETLLHCLDYPVPAGEPADTALIDLLLAHGASVGDTDVDGNTPLHLVVARNLEHVELVRFLLSRGADISAKNSKGNTPLHEAAGGVIYLEGRNLTPDDRMRAQNEMMRVLQEAGGNVNVMDQQNTAGKTPRQIRDETRSKWLEEEESHRQWLAGIGR
jgi:ankyrin repeat protein